jgi:hypothetical protein
MTEPNDDAYEQRTDDANELLSSPAADEFAKALDLLGWMIVQQKNFYIDERTGALDLIRPDGRRWLMNGVSNDCPPWADEYYPDRASAIDS